MLVSLEAFGLAKIASEPIMPGYGMDTTETRDGHGKDTDFIHKK